MDSLPEEVLQAWKNRAGAVVFTTVAPDGTPAREVLSRAW